MTVIDIHAKSGDYVNIPFVKHDPEVVSKTFIVHDFQRDNNKIGISFYLSDKERLKNFLYNSTKTIKNQTYYIRTLGQTEGFYSKKFKQISDSRVEFIIQKEI